VDGELLTITLADGDDARVRSASCDIVKFGITPILVTRDSSGLSAGVDVIDPADPGEDIERIVRDHVEKSTAHATLADSQRNQLKQDPLLVAVAAVRARRADGCVAGASRPSADVARAALRIVGLAPERKLLSGAFIMVMPDGQVFGFGDCGVVPEPTAEQLAEIAIATAETYLVVVGETPRVAMLSFSTKGSAEHSSVSVVREATAIVATQFPDLAIDGELQFDAAVSPEVGATKAPDSSVAGKANVLIFPNLAAGNIAYKVTQRLGGAEAFGPLLQGLAAPVNDLSRGCSTQDIVNISVITGAQALGRLTASTAVGV
jgi:phosphotransacetylase